MVIDELKNRLTKRFLHLRRWAKREGVHCFRVYEKDLPSYPFILDWYEGDAVVWLYDRKRDQDVSEKEQLIKSVLATIAAAFSISLDHVHVKFRSKQAGLSQQYEKLSREGITKVVSENGLKFKVNFSDYLDTGLFLDHRHTRALCRKLSEGKRVLNLFAYTGAFTCYALDGGALSTTSVDMNKNYLQWAEENIALNQFPKRGSDRMISENCLSFVKRELSQNRYDVIICDPPTFSNSKKMAKSFNVDEHYPELIGDCLALLSPEGTLIFSTNSRGFKLDPKRLRGNPTIKELSKQTIPEDFRNKRIHQCWQLSL